MTKNSYWVKFYDYGPQSQLWGYSGPGWYFWDESETFAYGPYESEDLASRAMDVYAKTI